MVKLKEDAIAAKFAKLGFWCLFFVQRLSEQAGFGEKQEWSFSDHAETSQTWSQIPEV